VKSFLRRDGVVLIVYSVLAVVLTYPLITHFDSHAPGQPIDAPALAWNLWWVKFSIFNLGTSPLYTDYLYYPLGVNLVANTSTFLNGVLALPLQILCGTIVANNLIIYFALVSGAYGATLLAREVMVRVNIHSNIAAVIAGAFFGFGAWHINYVNAGHPMLLSSEWIPFFALYLIRADRSAVKNGMRAGLFFGLTAWTELTFIPLLATFTLAYAIYQTILIVRRAARARQVILNFIAFGIITFIGTSPLLWSLLTDSLRYGYYIAPGLGRAQVFSAEPISFFVPSAAHPILGGWANSITNANTSYAFIGYAALILAIAGLITARKHHIGWFWLLTAIFFALVLLGPTLIINETDTHLPMPFALLRTLPFVNANRYPVRYNTMLMLALVPLIAFGAARFLRMQRGKIIVSATTALLLFEQLVLPIVLADLRAPAILRDIANEPGDFTVMDVPLGWRDSVAILGSLDYTAQFFQTIHQKRLIGGLVSRHPAFKFQYYLELPVINSMIALETGREIDDHRRELDRRAVPEILRFFNVRYIVAQQTLSGDELMRYIQDIFPLTEIYRDETRTVYRVRQPHVEPTMDLSAETARLYFDDGWGRAQALDDGSGYRWATRNDSRMWLPLEPKNQTLIFRLRGTHAHQPMTVRINGRRMANLVLTDDWQAYAVPLSADLLRDGLNEIVFATETVPINTARLDNYVIGDTGVISPVDLAATSAGFDAGRFGEIWVAGKNVIANKRGYHLVAINSQTGAVDQIGSFDTFADANESVRLAQFIAALPAGEIVAGVAIDDVSKNLQPAAVEALHSIGVASDLRFQFRMGHAFIGVKGAQPGQALEQVDGRFPANVYVGKNVASDQVAFALGGVEIR
jgi:hypothetical protein